MPALEMVLLVMCVPGGPMEPDRHKVEARDTWAQWRGPLGTGVAPDAQPPVEWSETKNIRWKRVLPGKGHSSPVVWGERIFLMTAVPFGESLKQRFVRTGTHDNFEWTV